jgi:hypothetical protein
MAEARLGGKKDSLEGAVGPGLKSILMRERYAWLPCFTAAIFLFSEYS